MSTSEEIGISDDVYKSIIEVATISQENRKKKTELLYQRRIQRLIDNIQRNNELVHGHQKQVHYRDIIDEFNRLTAKREWSASTFRGMRSALLDHLYSQITQAKKNDLSKLVVAANEVINIGSGIFKNSPDHDVKGRALKAGKTYRHFVSISELNAVISHIAAASRRSVWANRTIMFALSTLYAGVRPSEWESARWTDATRTALTVKTAKRNQMGASLSMKLANTLEFRDGKPVVDNASHAVELGPAPTFKDPATGQMVGAYLEDGVEHRVIPIDPSHRFEIQAHLNQIKSHLDAGDPFEYYYHYCRRVLQNACKETFNNEVKICLYTMRHQFAANSKAIRGALASCELLGHSIRATSEYAGKNKSHEAMRIAGKLVRSGEIPQHIFTTEGDLAAQEYMLYIGRNIFGFDGNALPATPS